MLQITVPQNLPSNLQNMEFLIVGYLIISHIILINLAHSTNAEFHENISNFLNLTLY